jgi:hypothetical protein
MRDLRANVDTSSTSAPMQNEPNRRPMMQVPEQRLHFFGPRRAISKSRCQAEQQIAHGAADDLF